MTINSMVRNASAGLVGLVVTSAVVFFFAVNVIRIGGTHGRQM